MFPCQPSTAMATHAATALRHHLDLLLAALLCCGLLSGVLLAAAALALLLLLACALLAVAALAASDVCRLSAPAARALDAAAAELRLARAVALYAVLGAAVRASVALRAWAGALASRAGYAKNRMLRTAERFTVVVA